MKPVFICYSKCGTCQKARKWLESRRVEVDERPIREQRPTAEELQAWQRRSGLPLRRFFNTSGTLYREMRLSERLPHMDEPDMLSLLASDGMLVKRPLLILEHTVLAGFQEKQWEEALG